MPSSTATRPGLGEATNRQRRDDETVDSEASLLETELKAREKACQNT